MTPNRPAHCRRYLRFNLSPTLVTTEIASSKSRGRPTFSFCKIKSSDDTTQQYCLPRRFFCRRRKIAWSCRSRGSSKSMVTPRYWNLSCKPLSSGFHCCHVSSTSISALVMKVPRRSNSCSFANTRRSRSAVARGCPHMASAQAPMTTYGVPARRKHSTTCLKTVA